MNRGFLNGLLAGSLIGAVVGMMVFPQGQKSPRRYAGKSRRMLHQSNRMVERLSGGVKDWLD